MRRVATFIVGVAGILCAAYAEAAPPAPNNLVLIACRAEIRTDFAENQRPIPGVTYWQLYVNSGQELECQRIVMEDLQDQPSLIDPSIIPLDSNFGEHGQCARASMMVAADWDHKHPGWLTVAVGCPTPIAVDGEIVGWKDPECPSTVRTLPVTCRFDKSHV